MEFDQNIIQDYQGDGRMQFSILRFIPTGEAVSLKFSWLRQEHILGSS